MLYIAAEDKIGERIKVNFYNFKRKMWFRKYLKNVTVYFQFDILVITFCKSFFKLDLNPFQHSVTFRV